MALSGIKITGDNKWHDFKYGYELPKKCRKEFNWMTDEEYDTSNFVKYRNRIYSLDEFMLPPKDLKEIGWDGIYSDSYFSGVLIKVSSDGEQYKVGSYIS